jgi:hypothetical protein
MTHLATRETCTLIKRCAIHDNPSTIIAMNGDDLNGALESICSQEAFNSSGQRCLDRSGHGMLDAGVIIIGLIE